HRDLAFQRGTDQVRRFHLDRTGTALVHDGDRAAQLLLMHQSPLDATLVGAEDHEIPRRDVQAADVIIDDRPGVEMIDGNVKKPLHLGRVEVEGQDTVSPGGGQQVGDQLGGDRYPADVLAILPGIAIVGQHDGEPGGTGALEAVEHDQQLHEVLVDG